MTSPLRPPIPRKKSQPDESDEALAADILAYLAEDEDRILRFFDLTGFTPQSLRRAAEAPGFAASIIAYLAADDRLFLAFAASRSHDPAALEAVRQRLSAADGAD